jgi:hypothetical protein
MLQVAADIGDDVAIEDAVLGDANARPVETLDFAALELRQILGDLLFDVVLSLRIGRATRPLELEKNHSAHRLGDIDAVGAVRFGHAKAIGQVPNQQIGPIA